MVFRRALVNRLTPPADVVSRKALTTGVSRRTLAAGVSRRALAAGRGAFARHVVKTLLNEPDGLRRSANIKRLPWIVGKENGFPRTKI